MESRVITRLIANLEVVINIRVGQKITTLYNDLNIDNSAGWLQAMYRTAHGDTKEKTIDAITIIIENSVVLYDLMTDAQSSCALRVAHCASLLRALTDCLVGLRILKLTYPDTTSCHDLDKMIEKIIRHTTRE